MKKVILITVVVLNGWWVTAQQKDANRMNRDLKISEDIISSIFKGQAKDGHFYSVRPKAAYVPDFGVMISIASNNHFYSKNMNTSFSFSWDDGSEPVIFNEEELQELEEQAEQLAEEAEELSKMHMEAPNAPKPKNAQEAELQAKQMEAQAMKREVLAKKMEVDAKKMEQVAIYRYEEACCDEGENYEKEIMVISSDKDRQELQAKMKQDYKDAITLFFTDYADLIGQLGDDEKIMLTAELSGSGHGPAFESGQKSKLSASVSRKDISSYKSGKLTKDKFIELIAFTENEGAKKSPDLELLSSIFQRLYKSDLATTYYTNESIPYERLDNFGAIYKMKMYSSTSYGKDNHKITTLGKSGLTQKERDDIVNGMYPQFEKELKDNILDYAKTVKSLNDDENLIFQVKLTQCEGCEMPTQIDVTVRQSVLKAYDSGKMKREEALSKISVKTGK